MDVPRTQPAQSTSVLFGRMGDTQAGWRHFAVAEWAEARDSFAAALVDDAGDPAALDGLGQSLWWLGEREAGIASRREAYAAFRRRGDVRAAAGVAVYLAGEHRIDGQPSASAGWLARARRLLDGAGTVSELGWLHIEEAKRADDPAVCERFAREALEVAHELASPDIECMALAQLGRAVVGQGRVAEGMGLLDEAMTVALGGETSDPLACGDACCTTLVVCDGIADLQRAAEWCEAVVDFAERRRFTPLQSWCRAIFGAVLVRSGEWERAEQVLAQALERKDDRRRGRAGRCRWRCWPACACGRGGRRRRGSYWPASRMSAWRSQRSCSFTSRSAISSSPERCSSAAVAWPAPTAICFPSTGRWRSRRAITPAPRPWCRRCARWPSGWNARICALRRGSWRVASRWRTA